MHVKTIIDALRGIGCTIVAFPITGTEMQTNLDSMLGLPPPKRHGYTHEAMRRGEVLEAFVKAVARNPEQALEAAGVRIKPITLNQFPHQKRFFDDVQYEDFYAAINWGNDIAAREHDATCMALLMRLRAGHHHSDVFRCGYVFVTRNTTFCALARSYCLQNRLTTVVQQGPIIHQRELATVAWLRTGLGAALDDIPRSHLIANCDRVLRLKMEVQEAVAAKLAKVTPEKLEQFELLIQDHRSVRRLADETLNDEKVVTTENATALLEAMREASISEERERFQKEMQQQQVAHRRAQQAAREQMEKMRRERDEVQKSLTAAQERDQRIVERLINQTNTRTRWLERAFIGVLLALGAIAVFDFLTGWFAEALWWKIIAALGGLVGLYHLMAHLAQRRLIGVATALDWIARAMFSHGLRRREMQDRFDMREIEIARGQINRRKILEKSASPSATLV